MFLIFAFFFVAVVRFCDVLLRLAGRVRETADYVWLSSQPGGMTATSPTQPASKFAQKVPQSLQPGWHLLLDLLRHSISSQPLARAQPPRHLTIDPQREISGEAIEAQEPMKLLKGKE
jgi:hypothetical protein